MPQAFAVDQPSASLKRPAHCEYCGQKIAEGRGKFLFQNGPEPEPDGKKPRIAVAACVTCREMWGDILSSEVEEVVPRPRERP